MVKIRAASHDSEPGIWASGAKQSHPTHRFSSEATAYSVISERERAGSSPPYSVHTPKKVTDQLGLLPEGKGTSRLQLLWHQEALARTWGSFQNWSGKPECMSSLESCLHPCQSALHRGTVELDELAREDCLRADFFDSFPEQSASIASPCPIKGTHTHVCTYVHTHKHAHHAPERMCDM